MTQQFFSPKVLQKCLVSDKQKGKIYNKKCGPMKLVFYFCAILLSQQVDRSILLKNIRKFHTN